ncbi:MAG: hypothetical protein WC503_00020 [Candidatus Shapirobacteria bacterium]
MKVKNSDKLKIICKYIGVFYLFTGIVYLFLNNRLKDRKSFVLQDQILYNYKISDNDPCTTSILDDPQQSETSYFKVNFHCGINKSKYNTFSLDAIKNHTARSSIDEVLRINQIKLPNDWSCYYERNLITDYNQEIVYGRTIDCFAPGISVADIYSKP